MDRQTRYEKMKKLIDQNMRAGVIPSHQRPGSQDTIFVIHGVFEMGEYITHLDDDAMWHFGFRYEDDGIQTRFTPVKPDSRVILEFKYTMRGNRLKIDPDNPQFESPYETACSRLAFKIRDYIQDGEIQEIEGFRYIHEKTGEKLDSIVEEHIERPPESYGFEKEYRVVGTREIPVERFIGVTPDGQPLTIDSDKSKPVDSRIVKIEDVTEQ